MNKNFAAFILSYGRPNRVLTYRSLRKHGYTGPIYIIVSTDDSTIDEYRANYGDKVVVFDKDEVKKTFDTCDNSGDLRTVVFARNVCHQVAEELGIDYFVQLDDDYTRFVHKFDEDFRYVANIDIKNLDIVFELIVDYYLSIDAPTIAMAQNGDFIGGGKGELGMSVRTKRKSMNTFFCSIDRPFKFKGRINEDVNTYVLMGRRGVLTFTIMQVAINQNETQKNTGGMTDIYLSGGTYIKSFYTVMCAPSCVTINPMGSIYNRLHHRVSWNNAAVRIISEKHKK